jgi:hypothetical protein
MNVRFARTVVAVFMVGYAVAVTWPGMVPFNRIRPLVLGLPFSMAWIALWILAGCLVLWMLDRVESAERARRRRHRAPEA